ncbi:efflux RND transporter periplasmic adaptor subunit [Staphylococcus hominis]
MKKIIRNKKIWISITLIFILLLIITLLILKKKGYLNFNNYDTYKVYTVKKEKSISRKGVIFPRSIKTYRINKNIGEYLRPQIKDKQKVKKGHPLIYYNTNSSSRPDLVNNINNIKEDLNHDYHKLAKHNSVSNQRHLSDDQQKLFKAQQKLNDHDNESSKDIYAAFDGKVKFSQYNSNKNGTEILKLISNKSVIKLIVSQFTVDNIKKGDDINFQLDNNNNNIKGKILSIDDLPLNMESTKRNKNIEKIFNKKNQPKYIVTISHLSENVRAGFTGRVTILSHIVEIPKDSIVDKNHVFIVDKGNHVQKRKVKIIRVKDKFFVKDGLESGNQVIEKPKQSLHEGELVNIIKN